MDIWKLRGKVPDDTFTAWEVAAKEYVEHMALLLSVVRGGHSMTGEEWKETRDTLSTRRHTAYKALVKAGEEAGLLEPR